MTILQLSAQSFASPGASVDVMPLALPSGTAATYEWFVDDEETPRSTGQRFSIPPDLYDSAVTARATYVDASGTTVIVFSEPIKVNAAPSGTPLIAGTFEEDGLVSVVTPSAIKDLDGLGDLPLAYQWLADGLAIPDAQEEFLVLTQAQVGKRISVRASYIDGDGKSESVTSLPSVAVKNLNDPATGSFRIDGLFQQDQTLTAVKVDLADEDGLPDALTYLWKADGVLVQGTRANQFVLGQAQVGKTISLTVRFTDLQNTVESIAADNDGQVTNVNDPTLGTLKIAGQAQQGARLAADTSDLKDQDGLGRFSYQWLQDGVEIKGATQSALLLDGQSFVGHKIGLQVVHTDSLGTVEPMLSAETIAIANVNDLPTGTVIIEGESLQYATLTASQNLKDVDGMPSTVSYQWLADGQAIDGATENSLILQQAQVGRRISVKVSYTDELGASEAVTSAATKVIQNINDPPQGTVEISGKVREAETLQAVTSTLSDEDNNGVAPGPLAYQWRANGVNIAGATSSSLLLTQSQVGQSISVVVKYTDKLGQAESVTSANTAAVANVNNKPTGAVTVTGTAQEDRTLSATQNLADLDGVGNINWRWFADGRVIPGEEQSTLVLKQAQVGKVVTAEASYTDLLGEQEAVVSAGTAKVANVQDPCTGTVDILGTGFQGETLSLDLNLTDEDGIANLSYQWLMNGVALPGATQNSLLLTQAQVGNRISVKVTATDSFNVQTLFQASQSSPIENVNDAPSVSNLVLSGPSNKSIKGTLTATDVDGDPYTFLLSQSPTHGKVTLNENTGLFEYLPELNYSGADQFSYQATDGMDLSQEATVQLNLTSLSSRAVTGSVYFWGNSALGSGHQLLKNVDVKATSASVAWSSATTTKSGAYIVPGINVTQVALAATKSTLADTTIKPAIGLNDVLSALKLYLGKTTADSSPYAMMAADFDANGKVELSDVLNILKTYLGKAASVSPQWTFVDAAADLGGMTAKSCLAPAPSLNLVDASTSVNLVGVLRGDVNGSWSQLSGYDLFSG
jgi:hypothetical protein